MKERVIMARQAKILLPDIKGREYNKEANALVYALARNIESLGFSLDYRMLDDLRKCTKEEITTIYNDIMPILKHMVGDDVVYKPMYPGFPEQVWEADELELYLNAMLHYMSAGQWIPDYPEEELKRCQEDKEHFPDLEAYKKFTTLQKADMSDFHTFMNATLTMRSRFTNENEQDVQFYVKKYANMVTTEIPFKENAIFVANELIKNNKPVSMIANYLKTPTDVLRYALVQSGKSATMTDYIHAPKAKNFNNKVFSKKNRHLFMSLFEKNPSVDDFCKHSEKFLIMIDLMHIWGDEYKTQYPNAWGVLKKLKDGELYSFNSELEYWKNKDYKKYIDLFATKPGFMIQNLDAIVRNAPEDCMDYILEVISKPEFIKKVSPTILAKTMSHFADRMVDHKYRCAKYNQSAIVNNETKIFTKNYIFEDNRFPLSETVATSVVDASKEALSMILSEKNTIGKVYVDPALEKSRYLVPFGGNKNSGARDLPEGTIINMDNKMTDDKSKQYITLFCYWKDREKRVDVDLNVSFIFEDGHMERIDFTHLRNDYACHSGDFVSGYDGACEFICIDRTKLPKGLQLIVPGLNVYSGAPYSSMEQCHVGVVLDDKTFNPQDVFLKTDLKGRTTRNVPCMFDVTNNTFCYLNIDGQISSGGTATTFLKDMMPQIQTVLDTKKFTLLELIDLNVKARGEYTDNIEEADVIFTEDLNILIDEINANKDEPIKAPEDAFVVTPYDKEVLLAYFLPEKDPVIIREKVMELEAEMVEKEMTLDEKLSAIGNFLDSVTIPEVTNNPPKHNHHMDEYDIVR